MKLGLRWTVMLLAVLLTVAACGKKGDPVPPSGDESTFPEAFPQR